MPQYKVVFQYTQPDKGWSEQFYRQASSIQDAAIFGTNILNAAIAFRPALTVLRKIRVSDVANNRNSVVINVDRANATATAAPDIAGAAVVWTLVAPSIGAKRQLWLRGMPDDAIQRSAATGQDILSPFTRSLIRNYTRRMVGEGLQVRSLLPLTVAPMVYKNILAIAVASDGTVTLTMEAGWLPTASGRVIISQLDPKLWPGLSGHFAVSNVVGTTFKIAYRSHLAVASYSITKGRSRPEEYQYGVIDADLSDFNHLGTRDTGKNPLGGRGRRSRQLTRSL